MLLALAARAQAPAAPRLTAFLLGVEPARHLVLRLEQFGPEGFRPVDSVRLVTDGAVELRSTGTETGLFRLALDRYSRTDLVLAPSEVPHFAATVREMAQRGVYLEQSAENTAYYDVLHLVQHYDTLVGRAHETLAARPDTSRAYEPAAQYLERLHRNLNLQLRARQARYPGTFAATVVAALALLPERLATAAFKPGYLPWLRAHYLNTFPFDTDAPLRHYLGAARVAYFLNVLGPSGEGGRRAAADALLARRQGHDLVNAWLYRLLVTEAVRQDDDALARHLRLTYPPDACTPALPAALAAQLAQMADLEAGQALPELTVPDSAGRAVSLRTVAAAHRLTAVVAWVSWCHTCEAELPRLAAAYPALRARGLEVVTLALDDTRPPWVAALRHHRLPWPLNLAELVPLAQSLTARRLHARQLPKLLLVDAAGRVVGRYASVAELTAAAATYLAQAR